MPYFCDSQVANEIDYRQDTPLQSNISTGCPAQCILFGIFGIDVAFDGTITINPRKTTLSDKMDIKGLRLRGKEIDISVNGDMYEVVVDGESFTANIGSAITIEN